MDDGNIFLPQRTFDRIAAGMLGGIAAGIPMILALCIGYAVVGRPFFGPLRLIAEVLAGEYAILPSAGIGYIFLGLAIHLICSAFFGGLLGTITLTRHIPRLMVWGVIYSMTLWWLMQFVVLPTGLDLPLVARMPPGLFALGHFIFGLTVSATLVPIEDQIRRREREVAPLPSVPTLVETEEQRRRVA